MYLKHANRQKIFQIITIFAFIGLSNIAIGNNVTVASMVALQTAVNNAISGDTIILTNGTYLNNALTINTSNIKIIPQTIGGVILNGTNAIIINGNSVLFSGFQFTSGSITGNAITVNGNYNTLSQLNFNGYNAGHMIIISGQNNVVSNCNFQNKPALNMVNHGGTGDMVQIIPNASIPGYNTIRYCSFKHMPGFGGDFGNECIRIGDGAYSTYVSRTLVEYCYFEDTGSGDSEAISVKSRENCLRFNTMYNNPDAMFSFRNGDNNVAYSNFFIKSGGIRCKQSNNIFCYNNYFQESGKYQNSSLAGSGTYPIRFEYFGSGYGNNFNIIHNTFYNCLKSSIDTGIINCTWANNIFYSNTSTIFSGSNNGQNFAGNIYQGVLGLPITSGMNNINPLLVPNMYNYYGLSKSSSAIGTTSSIYPQILNIIGLNNDPNLLLDIEGQSRPATLTLKDIGCDQYTNGNIINYPLDSCQVGPFYLCNNMTKPICNNLTKPLFNTSNFSFCSGDSLKLSISNINKGDSLKWYYGVKSDLTNVSNKTFNDSTKLFVTRTDSIGCIISSDTIQLKKLAIPVAPTLSRDSANFLLSGTAGTTWYKDGVVLTDTTQKYKLVTPGSYTATTTTNGCTSVISNAYYYLVTNIINLSLDEFIKLGPNPFTNQLNFDFIVKGYQKLNIEVFDIAIGTKFASQQNLTAGSRIILGQLSAGTYVIKVTSADNKISYQFKMVKL